MALMGMSQAENMRVEFVSLSPALYIRIATPADVT